MKNSTYSILTDLIDRYEQLSCNLLEIEKAFEILQQTYQAGGTIFVCGNGGSASDSEHIVGELMKQFKKTRPIKKEIADNLSSFGDEGKQVAQSLEGAIPAISLTSHIALTTAFSNDNSASMTFAQQLYGLCKENDCLISLSTSGNSKNCVFASLVAKAKGIKTLAFTGKNDSKLSKICDLTIKVSETETYKIQELHLPLYHTLCAMLEEENF